MLDNPIWASLTTRHRHLAIHSGLACKYLPDVSPLAALQEPTEQAFADLAAITGSGETLALFTIAPIQVPDTWEVTRERWIEQMVFSGQAPTAGRHEELAAKDVPEMLALATATEPGPFKSRTIEMGLYLGIRSADHRLVSMAGQRLCPDGFTEISAVCTYPESRARGYAGALVSAQVAQICASSNVPFLHVKTENGAKFLYEKLGFQVRCSIRLTVIAKR